MEIKNIGKAAKRIKKAIKNEENIILYGDSDLDGAASILIMKEGICNFGGKVVSICFPDREKEGYGLNEKSLKILKKYSPALLITCDLGISSFKEMKMARRQGFDVIIVDHHEILDKLPDADIIIDPKQPADKYPFKNFATVGIAFKLVKCLLGKAMTKNLRKGFLELTALATIADMMPRKGENETLIQEGLFYFEKSWRPGLKAFLEAREIRSLSNLNQKVSRIISILNVRDISDNLPASFRLLSAKSEKEAKEIIKKLLKKNKIRKKKIEKMMGEVERSISEEDRIILGGRRSFESVLMSSVASILCRKYSKPVFLYKRMVKESLGTVRTPPDVNGVSLLKECSKYLLTYGGHPQAAGFRINNKNLANFEKCLKNAVGK
ncbi:MAG: DHH family phosphoesterase [Candidatus Pacebacteria bacterium]|nr:DHH family phosphoesterase [Candidatus Paceibacterota bacterium]